MGGFPDNVGGVEMGAGLRRDWHSPARGIV